MLSVSLLREIQQREPHHTKEEAVRMAYGWCKWCNEFRHTLEFVDPMTRYADEERNYVGYVCTDCASQYREHWRDMWDTYHSGLL